MFYLSKQVKGFRDDRLAPNVSVFSIELTDAQETLLDINKEGTLKVWLGYILFPTSPLNI